jgi:predicted dehydrogenase
VSGILEHASGVLSTITTSFDGVRTTAAPIEVHGETGTLAVPDPNRFDGPVRLFDLGGTRWRTLEPSAGYAGGTRGVGLLDFITADARRPPRANGDLALHVLDALTALLRSTTEGRQIELTTTAQRPPSVPLTPAREWKAWP